MPALVLRYKTTYSSIVCKKKGFSDALVNTTEPPTLFKAPWSIPVTVGQHIIRWMVEEESSYVGYSCKNVNQCSTRNLTSRSIP
jgi:hypothetical protein